MKKCIILTIPVVMILFFGCTYPYDNPVDPSGNEYQGWLVYSNPEQFALISPSDGDEIANDLDSYNLVWTEIVGEDEYTYQVADDEGFTQDSILSEGTVTTYSHAMDLSSLVPGFTYYWRARCGSGDWTEANSFSIPALEIGDTGPAGGLIFYIDEADDFSWTYLEAAPASTEWQSTKWSDAPTPYIVGADGTAVGTGQENTDCFVAYYNGAYNDSVPVLCDSLEYNGYDDWFLPSLGELNLMYENLHLNDLGGFGATDFYASSSEYSANDYYVWGKWFTSSGYEDSHNKDSYSHARAARAF